MNLPETLSHIKADLDAAKEQKKIWMEIATDHVEMVVDAVEKYLLWQKEEAGQMKLYGEKEDSEGL